jgi:hypothetical protein
VPHYLLKNSGSFVGSDLAMQPTWMDHHYLNFWLWACLCDAEAYLESSRQFNSVISSIIHNTHTLQERISAARNRQELDKYHFVMTMGSLVKHLNRLAPLFPSIQPTFNAAEHLKKEGLYLRNMIEHAESNLDAAAKGTPRGGFVRKSNLLSDLPGDSQGEADATATIIDNDGHWLGGRLNVERVIAEVRHIYEAAQAIPPPSSIPLP